MGPEKRKHTRVAHKGAVEFVTANRKFQGTSLNLSRNGMQVVVNLPESYETIRSITFQLPAAGERIEIPCRLVRTSSSGGDPEQTLGIEFQHEVEAQLLLIEKFIQDSAARIDDSRQLPRTSCRILDVQSDKKEVRVLSVDNLSTDGLLFSFTGALVPGDQIGLVLKPSGEQRSLRLGGVVVFVIENAFREAWTAGLRFDALKETEASRLRNLIFACSSGSTLRGMYEHLDTKAVHSGYRITDPARVIALLSELARCGMSLNVLLENNLTIWESTVLEVRPETRVLAVRPPTELPPGQVRLGRTAYIGFYWRDSSHYFKTGVAAVEADRLLLHLPGSMFRSDKRSYGRKSLEVGSHVVLTVDQPNAADVEVPGTLVDISRRGFLCEVDHSSSGLLRRGQHVRYNLDERLGLDSHGRIRHMKTANTPNGPALRIGIEAGIASREIQVRRITSEEWSRSRPFLPEAEDPPAHRIESKVVCYRNRAGKEIRALVNATQFTARGPVVVIPPSYGKRKESYAPLVATLLANFWRLGKPLVTIRYDGINRPGESHNDLPNPRRGYEMLSYRISQGLEDLEATLDFIHADPRFQTQRVILITFSMSALDARKYLSTHHCNPVDLWISCMGVPCTQSTLRNILGGIDIINNQRLGVPNGIMGLLGHLVNMDILAQDVLDRKYAYLTDARFDMAQIREPVIWISGVHDKWVETTQVIDLMSVRARGHREILEIPCGHNLHTSDDAIQTFKIVAAELYRELHGERLQPCDPCKDQMLRLIGEERERLQDRRLPPLTEYWRGYLIGNERNHVGYDFYRNLEEFRDFLRDQVELLQLGEHETIADLGCGTGLFLEVLLESLSRCEEFRPDYEICALDLVPEALDRARAKCERVLRTFKPLDKIRIRFLVADLEPSRLAPVAQFLRSGAEGLAGLRGKIEGLSGGILDRLLELHDPRLDSLLRGAWPANDMLSGLQKVLDRTQLKVVQEFNLAARFLLDRLTSGDLGKTASLAAECAVRTSDLAFEVLNFGDSDSTFITAIPEKPYSKIVASLFVSYLFNPEPLLGACYRLLQSGGTLLVSSMRPDSDISTIFTNYIRRLQRSETGTAAQLEIGDGLSGALAMLNEAATLFELEEDGYFRFFTDRELHSLLQQAGFTDISLHASLGDPSQACIAIGKKAY